MRCLLIGNYGTGNFGDEALRLYFLTSFPEIEWQVVSAHPKEGELPRLPAGIRSLLTTNWLRTLGALWHCDAVVFGGGTLFSDSESGFACFLWWIHVQAANLFYRPVFFAFQGVGPFRIFRYEWLARSALQKASFLSVRDRASAERAEALRLSIKVIHSFDPIYKEFLYQITDSTQNVLAEKKAGHSILSVIPRGNATPDFLKRYGEQLAGGHFTEVVIVSLQPEDIAETVVCNRLEQLCSLPCTRIAVHSAEELISALSPASAVLSQRYHGSLAAIALGKKLILSPQAEGDKHAELGRYAHDAEARTELPVLVEAGESALKDALRSLIP